MKSSEVSVEVSINGKRYEKKFTTAIRDSVASNKGGIVFL
jgi:hypothetical protein